MFILAKKHPLIALVISAFAAFLIWSVIMEREAISPVASESAFTTESSLSSPNLSDDLSFDECTPLSEAELNAQQTSDTFPVDIPSFPCFLVTRACDDIRDLQSELNELSKAIKQKYGLPEDAVDIYGDFLEKWDLGGILGLQKNDIFQIHFRELITSFKYLRVALNDKDQNRVDELTELQKRPLESVTNYCKQVP